MEAKDFQSLVEQLGELTAGQRDAPVEAIKRKSSVHDAIALIARCGCSMQNQRSPGRREAQTTAVGSTSPAGMHVKLASVSRPVRRARRTARCSSASRRR